MDHHDYADLPHEYREGLYPVEWIGGTTQINMWCGCRATVNRGDTLWVPESGTDSRRRRARPVAFTRRTVH